MPPMKILSRYVIKEHVGPFLFAFFMITFLLVIDLVPRIVDKVIDKDLSWVVVLELVGVNLAWMLALSVPMAVLVGTLMAFGRLTADFEIIAMKASGVNLLRILIPLLLAAGVITVAMSLFSDRILPDLNKRSRTLWGDISAMRPTLVFRSGIFITDIPGFLVLVDHIDHATSRVEGVHITETRAGSAPRVVVAEYGYLKMLDDNRTMNFTLYNGEIHTLDLKEPSNYRRIDFKEHVINVADAGSGLVRSDSDYRNDREMPIAMMQEQVDASVAAMAPLRKTIHETLGTKMTLLFADSIFLQAPEYQTDSAAVQNIRADAAALVTEIERNNLNIFGQKKAANRYLTEIHKKWSIPAASFAFILLGAPLGILSKRGGMGIAIAISIILFVIYWAFLIGGEDLSDRGMLSPFLAMWAANILMGLIGVFLFYLVLTEKPIIEFLRRPRK